MKNNLKYIVMCGVFIVSLIVLAMSASYAFTKASVTNVNNTQTTLKSTTYNITTSLTTASGISVYDLPLIEESEIPTKSASLDFDVVSNNNHNSGKLDIYLTDISISKKLIDTYGSFRWQLLDGSTVISSGSFNDIETNGVSSTTQTDTDTTLYFEKYYLKRELTIGQTQTKNFTFRVYLLNDPNGNQIELTNQPFECKVTVEAYMI